MKRSSIRSVILALFGALACAAVGCGPHYHAYRHCWCAPYDYRSPAPLPYTPYGGCPTPLATEAPLPTDAPPSSPSPGAPPPAFDDTYLPTGE